MSKLCDSFNLVLPAGLFTGFSNFALYSKPQHQKLREYVESHPDHCHDIAINFVVSRSTNLPAIVLSEEIQTAPRPDDPSGLSSSEVAKIQARLNNCLKGVTEYFKGFVPSEGIVEAAAFNKRLNKAYHGDPSEGFPKANRRFGDMWKELGTCASSDGVLVY